MKTCTKEAAYFHFWFLGKSILHHFLFWFFKNLMPLMHKVILLLPVFNFKTQNSLYILIGDSLTGFLKLLSHQFNYVDCLETNNNQ